MTMSSTEVYEAIEAIGSVSSTGEKKRLLRYYGADPNFFAWVQLAVDSFVRFGIADLPKVIGHGNVDFDDQTRDILQDLASRTLTGNEARAVVERELERLNDGSAELFRRILTKDLRAGIGAKTLNSVMKGWVGVFEVMLAKPFEEKRVKGFPVVAEPKLDGVRVAALVTEQTGEVEFLSRSGKPYAAFEHMREGLARLTTEFLGYYDDFCPNPHGLVLDGEMVSGDFNDTVSSARKKDVEATDAVFHVFDAIPLRVFKDEQRFDMTYQERREFLEHLGRIADWRDLPVKVVPRYLCGSHSEIQSIYQAVRDRGLEGVIVKPLDHFYEKKRSTKWMKIKAEESVDVRVTGAFEGTGKYAGTLGGLIVDFEGKAVNVGGGFSDAQRDEFWAIWEAECDMTFPPGAVGNLMGRMIEVEYHEVTRDGSLRHPRFVRFRDDKDERLAATG